MSYPLSTIISSRKENPYYDVLLYWSLTHACNLQCVYCWDQSVKIREKIAKIDCHSLKEVLDKTDRIFLFSFTGGEPFLVPNILDTCAEITNRHFIRFNTNLISGNIKEFTARIDPKRVWDIEASCHIKELERHNLLDKYINNFSLCRDEGFSIAAVEVAYPTLSGKVGKYKEFFKKNGIELAFTQFCGNYNGMHYPESYTEKELKIFGLENDLDVKMYYSKGKICNAGYNVGVLLPNGDVTPCFEIKKVLGNIYDKIKFEKELTKCPRDTCGCPLNCYHQYLFERAIVEMKK